MCDEVDTHGGLVVKELDQEQFNEILKALVFASSVDVIADVEALGMKSLDAAEALIASRPNLRQGIDLKGVQLFCDTVEEAEEEELFERIQKMFGDKIKIGY